MRTSRREDWGSRVMGLCQMMGANILVLSQVTRFQGGMGVLLMRWDGGRYGLQRSQLYSNGSSFMENKGGIGTKN